MVVGYLKVVSLVEKVRVNSISNHEKNALRLTPPGILSLLP